MGDRVEIGALGNSPGEYLRRYFRKISGLSLSRKQTRLRRKFSQELAKRLHSGQSHVAKIAGDNAVSIDRLVQSLLDLDSKPKDIARHIRESEQAGLKK